MEKPIRERAVRQAWDVYFKNASVGAHAIAAIERMTLHAGFRSLLEKQSAAYKRQEQRARDYFQDSGVQPPRAAVWAAKRLTDMGIFTHTLKDRSVSNLAGLMVQGTNMGVITLLKTLHDTGRLPDDVLSYGNGILKRENAYMESLKQYL